VVNPDVGEAHDARTLVNAAIGELDGRLEAAVRRQSQPPRLDVAPDREALAVGDAEDHVHRIGLGHGREQHAGSRNEGALRGDGATRDSRDGRFDAGVLEIEPRLVDARTGAFYLGIRHLLRGHGVIELLLAHGF
jgi:hypothetical protein